MRGISVLPDLSRDRAKAHNKAVTDSQAGVVCPECGSAAAVHSIEELATLARSRLGQPGPGPAGTPGQGYAAEPQAGQVPGWAAEPQAGPAPQPGQAAGWAAEPQPGALPQQGPVPGWAAEPQTGPLPVTRGRQGSRFGLGDVLSGDSQSLGDDIAGAALGAAAGFLGRSIGRRVQRAMTDKVLPALAAKQEDMLRTQIAIAGRHPDLRACLTDKVIFLAGGSRVLPMANVTTMLTIEQSDALVARLRDG
jgi:hypothetical protein